MTGSQDRIAGALADRYTITRELGRGGMATVYLAEDLRHHRKVAIKVLKDDVSASVGAPRFLREIEIAAQLQHPHILPLLDSGEINGILYYVMPYVEGQSLRQRLAREGELPVGDAVRILVEVADALSYAHSRGVVHRDIKPDNIMLTGRHAVVADFGVARAVTEASAGGGTLTSLGVALGTPAYMAPEQAVADPHIDQRADIYALGVVAYELLAGRTPFTSASPQQMLAMQVTEKPDPPSRHRPGIAPALEQALMRCLEKRAADRFQSADDLLAILEPLATPSGGTAPTAARLPAAASPTPSRLKWIVAGAGVVGVAALVGWLLARDETPPKLVIGKATHVTADAGLEIHPDISPDGKFVAFAAGNFTRMRIFIRPVSGGRTVPLSDDSLAIEDSPRYSVDGSQILFLTRGGVSVAPSLGGSSHPIVPPAGTTVVRSADWSPDALRILFVRADSLYISASDGSAPQFLASVPDLHSCRWSPAGTVIACVTRNSSADQIGESFGNLAPSGIMLFPVTGGPGIPIGEVKSTDNSPVWSSDGRHLYFISNRDNTRDIFAVEVLRSGQPRGVPQRLTTGLGATSISLSRDGTRLAYALYSAKANIWSLPILTNGVATIERATALTSGSQIIESMRASPDGQWIVYDSYLGGQSHIWRVPVGGGPPQQLTTGQANEFAGNLSPDGRFVAYHSFRSGTRDIEVLALAGGEPERVTQSEGEESYPVWSADGNSILFINQVGGFEAFVTSRTATGWSEPRAVARNAGPPTWSPDQSRIVYADRRSQPAGRVLTASRQGGEPTELYRPRPGAPPAVGVEWGLDGRIYFKARDDMGRTTFWSVAPRGGPPSLLARLDDPSRPSSRIDFTISGQRIYFPIQDRQSDIYVAEITRKQ